MSATVSGRPRTVRPYKYKKMSNKEILDLAIEKMYEQIANVERPKEFGCENGRGIDLLRWGFFYDAGRLNQLVQHGYYKRDGKASTEELTAETADDSSFKYYYKGHEYFPIFQSTLNANPNLVGNSANKNEDNGPAFKAKWNVRPVVK